MGRKSLIRTNEYPYHIWARVNNRERWPISMDSVWEEFRILHNNIVERFEFRTLAFVLMNNHYHWLLTTPRSNLDEGMRHFQTASSKRILSLSGRQNRLYGGRYGWSVIRTNEGVLKNYRYILMNPVRSGSSTSPDLYPFSTYNSHGWKVQYADSLLSDVPKDKGVQTGWMMRLRTTDDEIRIQSALRRRVFKTPRNGNGYREF